MLGVSVIVAVLTAAATAWAHWLDPRLLVGVMPATGVLIAALLLLEPRYWAAPIVAGGVAILGAAAGVAIAKAGDGSLDYATWTYRAGIADALGVLIVASALL